MSAKGSSGKEAQMSFWDHLEELRWTLLRVVIALIIFAIAGFIVMPWLFDHVILAPTRNDFFLYQGLCKLSKALPFLPNLCDYQEITINLINIELTAQLLRHLTTSFWLAIVLICPYILYEIWKFVSPALYEHEKKNVRWVFLFGSVMFFIGCLVGYAIIFPMTFRFLYLYELSISIHNQITLDSYMSIFLMLVLVMGLVFEMPLIAWLLSQIGILKKSFFRKYRRHAIVVLVIAAALITPTQDPFTLTIVFLPLYGLYELSICFVKADEVEEEVSLDKI